MRTPCAESDENETRAPASSTPTKWRQAARARSSELLAREVTPDDRPHPVGHLGREALPARQVLLVLLLVLDRHAGPDVRRRHHLAAPVAARRLDRAEEEGRTARVHRVHDPALEEGIAAVEDGRAGRSEPVRHPG